MNNMAMSTPEIDVHIPRNIDFEAAAIAFGVVVLAGLLAWAAARWIGPRLAKLWERYAGARVEGIADRMCRMIRHLAAWIVLTLALNLYYWPPLSAFMIGLVAGFSAGMLVVHIVRGLDFAGWIAGLLGLFVFVAVLAGAVGGMAEVQNALDAVGFTIGNSRISLLGIIQIGIALVALFAVVRLANRLVGHSIKRATGLDAAQQLLAKKLAAIVIVVAAFFVGIDLVGIDLTALAVFSGALGLAIGFGLQKTLGNLFAGIILLWDRSIKPGDVIAVGDSFGTVNKIGVRAVSVITRDGMEHLIPNEMLMTDEVENWSYSSRNVRIRIPVGISYDCDMALAQKLMMQAAKEPSRVLKSPEPKVWMLNFGDSSVEHEIRLWITDPEEGVGNVRSQVLNRIWLLFKENGIELPFPQRDLHVKSWPAADGTGKPGSNESSSSG